MEASMKGMQLQEALYLAVRPALAITQCQTVVGSNSKQLTIRAPGDCCYAVLPAIALVNETPQGVPYLQNSQQSVRQMSLHFALPDSYTLLLMHHLVLLTGLIFQSIIVHQYL
jgi:hypothetical protein